MGFLLAVARKMSLTSKINQYNFETTQISQRKETITNRLSQLQQMAQGLDAESPDAQFLELQKQMLITMSNSLDLRLQQIESLSQIAKSEVNSLSDDAINAEIASSVGGYVG